MFLDPDAPPQSTTRYVQAFEAEVVARLWVLAFTE